MIFARKIPKIPEFYIAGKMSEFYIIIGILGGGAHAPLCPPVYAYEEIPFLFLK